jgi:hypothetical protein
LSPGAARLASAEHEALRAQLQELQTRVDALTPRPRARARRRGR